MEAKKLLIEHKETLSKSLILGIVMSILGYSFGVLLVDVSNIPFYIAGLIITPVSFSLRYFINKYWIFKKDE